REAEADREPSKAGGRDVRAGANEDEQKEQRHHHFVYEAAPKAIFAGAKVAITVGGKATHRPAGLPRCDQPQYEGGDDGADDLGDDVGDDVLVGAAPGAPQAEGDRRVEVSARDVTYGIGHGQDGQTER